jgi:glycosyltransferase involved in cell wall biosynthesis
MRHLVVVTPLPPTVSGIAEYGYHISQALALCGAFERVTVLTDRTPRSLSIDRNTTLRVEALWERGKANVGWKIATRLQALKPDLVWYNLGASNFGSQPVANGSGLLSMVWGFATGLPTVVTLHEMIDQIHPQVLQGHQGLVLSFGKRLFSQLSISADVVCVTLRHHANWLKNRLPAVRVLHIPHGTYNTDVLPESGNEELLTFASWAPFKGLENILRAFEVLHRQRPTLRLTVAGGEHPRFPGYLDDVRQAYNDHPGIAWVGFVPECALRAVFARATAVVLPYSATTGSSGVLYRAAAWGRPIVASNLPELRATAEEEGLLVQFCPPGDTSAFVAAILRLLSDPVLRSTQTEHNRNIITSRLTLSETCRSYLHAFDLALTVRRNCLS